MKKISLFMLIALAIGFTNCDKEEIIMEEETADATLLGRWVLEGFEQTVRYDFTEDKRFTIYGDGSGQFPTLEEFRAENPGISGQDWYYEGEVVVIDLDFGNYSRLIPEFTCDNQVIRWTDEAAEGHSVFFREGHDLTTCN